MAALMLLNMNDPASIAAWIRIRPREHWEQLKTMVRLQPKWRDAAKAAQALLRDQPER